MENISITIQDVKQHCLSHFPLLMEEYYGQNNFEEDNRFYSFDRMADFLIEEGFVKQDHSLIQEMAEYILLLLKQGADNVRNPVYVSFLEGLVDRGYKYPQLKGFIEQMPEAVRDFIKGFFNDKVLVSLGLQN